MMETDPVEIVARAIHGALAEAAGGISRVAGNPSRWPYDAQQKHGLPYRKMARSALLAMGAAVQPISDPIMVADAVCEAQFGPPDDTCPHTDECRAKSRAAIAIVLREYGLLPREAKVGPGAE